MALVKATLMSGINDAIGGQAIAPIKVGMDLAKAYQDYLSAGINAGGGSVTAVAGTPAAGAEIGDIFASRYPAPAIVGVKLAQAFTNQLMTLLSVYQTTIVATPGPLIGPMISAISNFNVAPIICAKDMADALDIATKSAQVIGVIPGSPPVPFAGPLS